MQTIMASQPVQPLSPSMPKSCRMALLLVPPVKKNQGFTVVEMIITTIVIGILAAILSPNILSLLKNNQVKAGLDQVEGALQDAQRQAIRISQQCTVSFIQDSSGKLTEISATPASCIGGTHKSLQTGVIVLNRQTSGGTVQLTNSPISVNFSFKGNTTTSRTIVISASDNQGERRCLAISNGLGIMRTGIYNNTTNDCQTTL